MREGTVSGKGSSRVSLTPSPRPPPLRNAPPPTPPPSVVSVTQILILHLSGKFLNLPVPCFLNYKPEKTTSSPRRGENVSHSHEA